MNYAGKIRRPYISQALALVSICRVLATKFEDTTYKVTKNIWPLEEYVNFRYPGGSIRNAFHSAFYDTLAALEAAVEAVKELKFYDLSIFENNEAKTAFDDAAASLENCFEQFGVRATYFLLILLSQRLFVSAIRPVGCERDQTDGSHQARQGSPHSTQQ